MGSGGSVPLEADQDSPDGSHKCVKSPPFADLGLPDDFEAFAVELIRVVKRPPRYDEYADIIKPDSCIEKTEDDGTIKYILQHVIDPEKAKQKNPEADGKAHVLFDQEVTFDKAGRALSAKVFNAPRDEGAERTLGITSVTMFLDPMQVIYYWELPSGDKIGGDVCKDALQPYINIIAGRLKERKCKLIRDDTAKEIRAIGSMNDVTDFDKFFDKYVQCCKPKENPSPGVTNENIEEEEKDGAIELKWTMNYAASPGQEAGQAPCSAKIVPNKDAGRVNIVRNLGTVSLKQVVEISKEPMSFKTWLDSDGEKKVTDLMWDTEQELVDQAITDAASWFW